MWIGLANCEGIEEGVTWYFALGLSFDCGFNSDVFLGLSALASLLVFSMGGRNLLIS